MLEGWQGDDYLILFDERESTDLSAKYELGKYLADHLIVGLKGWDDFIVKGPDGRLATVPTVPLDAELLAPLELRIDPDQVRPDNRYEGKVKWYIKPIIFGGDPAAGENMTWLSLEQHVAAVKWWNDLYQKMAR